MALALGGVNPLEAFVSLLVLAIELGLVCALGVGISALAGRPLFSIVTTYMMVALLCIGTLIAFGLSMSLVIEEAHIAEFGEFRLNLATRSLTRNDQDIALTTGDEEWRPSAVAFGAPVLSGATRAHAECTVERIVEAGDHSVVIGLVGHAEVADRDPLLYQRRSYAVWPGVPAPVR